MEENKKKIPSYLMPIIYAVLLAVGVFLGASMKFHSQHVFGKAFNNQPNTKNFTATQKLNRIFNFIKTSYVDSVNVKKLMGEGLNDMLEHLDPHSYYISPQEFTAMNQPLEGDFEGVGIEFRIIKDTVNVLGVLEGGPSKKVGIKVGDEIIKVDTELIAGKGITNKKIMKLLKGPAGTKVKITVFRPINGKTIHFEVKRAQISIKSVIAGYMINDSTGYVKITQFAENTYEEFHNIALKLKKEGMKTLILDLRDNGGGIMNSAVKIADEFLKKGSLIVYTQGRSRPRKDYYATDYGVLTNTKLAILINAGTASASEILTGAIQDNDRGIVIGRRSFGKGLVQEQITFPDRSALRLTVARYYTPSGRCIQKPYNQGIKKYREETYHRYLDGEMFSADSVHFPDSLKYHTKDGRVVYGGGGIMPDYFIPLDTSQNSLYLSELYYKGLFGEFALKFTNDKNNHLNKYTDLKDFITHFKVTDAVMNEFVGYAAKNKVKKNATGLKRSNKYIRTRIEADIAQDLFGEEGFYQVKNKEDHILQKALVILKKHPQGILAAQKPKS